MSKLRLMRITWGWSFDRDLLQLPRRCAGEEVCLIQRLCSIQIARLFIKILFFLGQGS